MINLQLMLLATSYSVVTKASLPTLQYDVTIIISPYGIHMYICDHICKKGSYTHTHPIFQLLGYVTQLVFDLQL